MLLLKKQGLVKSIKFKKYRYIGDPINAVKIFNDKKADELVFLDINATKENRLISIDFIREVGDEANMPFGVGGGIEKLGDIRKILNQGAEKVILNTIACQNPDFIRSAAEKYGSSTISICIDVKKTFFGNYKVMYRNASKKSRFELLEFTQLMEENGAGELIIQSINRDGTYKGYDLDLLRIVSENVTIPVVALGGAKDYNSFKNAINISYASAVAAGSLFVYHGPRKAVLINYPSKNKIRKILNNENTN